MNKRELIYVAEEGHEFPKEKDKIKYYKTFINKHYILDLDTYPNCAVLRELNDSKEIVVDEREIGEGFVTARLNKEKDIMVKENILIIKAVQFAYTFVIV